MRVNKRWISLCLVLMSCLVLFSSCAAPVEEESFVPNNDLHISADPTEEPPEQTPQSPEQTPEQTPQSPDQAPEQTPESPAETPEAPEQTPESPEEAPEAPEEAPDQSEEDEEEMLGEWNTTCMSFNVLMYDTDNSGYAAPATRAPWIIETIKKYSPDLLGCQEVTNGSTHTEGWDMYAYMVKQLGDEYGVSGLMDSKNKAGSKVGIDKYTIGSGLVIFWKKDRFELKDYGANVYSNNNSRHYQWVRLYDKQEDITILMTNTHLAPASKPVVGFEEDFAQQATELFLFWEKNCKKGIPLYATGDYNRKPSTLAYGNLAQERYMNSADCALEANAGAWLDHIFINSDVQECIKYHRCNETFEPKGSKPSSADNRNPEYCASDHYAVISYCTNI